MKLIKPLICILCALLLFCITAVFIILFSSCTPEKRLQHLIDKYPQLKTTDTLIKNDTLIIPGVKKDTTFMSRRKNIDTVIIRKDNLIIKYFAVDSLVYLSGECTGDTVIIIDTLYYERIQPAVTDPITPGIWGSLIIMVVIGAVLAILVCIIFKL